MESIEVFARDDIKLNILSALLGGKAEMTLYLESDGRDVPFTSLRPPAEKNSAAYRYNNFNVKENPSDDSVVFNPVVVGCPAVISVTIRASLEGSPRLDVIRKGAESPVRSFAMGAGKNQFALSPIDMKKYVMSVESAEGDNSAFDQAPTDISTPELRVLENAALAGENLLLEREIAGLQAEKESLAERGRRLRENLKWLSDNLEGEKAKGLEELKATLEVDEEVLRYYLDENENTQNTPGVVELVAEIKTGIGKLEDQIRTFVQQRQKKALDIERKLTKH
jgi:hypothetical protein